MRPIRVQIICEGKFVRYQNAMKILTYTEQVISVIFFRYFRLDESTKLQLIYLIYTNCSFQWLSKYGTHKHCLVLE